MFRRPPKPLVASALILAACGKGPAADDFTAQEFGEFAQWSRGLSDFGGGGGGGGGTDSGLGTGGGSASFDGTWQGTYTFTANLPDRGYSCSCSAGVTLGIIEGVLQVGQGDSCAMDCGINTRLVFNGTVGGSGAAAGNVTESTSFYFTTPWTGTFTESSGIGSYSDTVSTDQGTAEVSGSFTVAPL
jgi:hypothetical protein